MEEIDYLRRDVDRHNDIMINLMESMHKLATTTEIYIKNNEELIKRFDKFNDDNHKQTGAFIQIGESLKASFNFFETRLKIVEDKINNPPNLMEHIVQHKGLYILIAIGTIGFLFRTIPETVWPHILDFAKLIF